MNIPLCVIPQKNILNIISNRKIITVDSIPYIMRSYLEPREHIKERAIECKTRLMINPFIKEGNSLITEEVWETAFATCEDFAWARSKFRPGKGLDPVEQIYAYAPYLYSNYENTEELIVLYIDIEVATDGSALFPNYERTTILSVGYAVNEGEIQFINATSPNTDADLCRTYIDIVKETDPDIIVTFNGRTFDLPFLTGRCEKNGISTLSLSRIETGEPYGGRICFDLFWDAVDRDTTLVTKGIPNRKMKTVAKVYDISVGLEMIEHDMRNMKTLWIQDRTKILEYLHSDVHITRELSRIYLPQRIGEAEQNNVPLDSRVNKYKSFIPKLLSAREFERKEFCAILTNRQRYDGRTGTIYRLTNLKAPDEELMYQGANVELIEKGRFAPVYKLDACYHPSTDILTVDGWKKIEEITTEHRVATLTQNGKIEYLHPDAIHSFIYNNYLYHIHNTTSTDQLVTENHRIIHYKRTNNRKKTEWYKEYSVTVAKEFKESRTTLPWFGEWYGKEEKYIDIGEFQIPIEAAMEYIGAFLGDGNYGTNNRTVSKLEISVGEKKRDRVKTIMENFGIPYKESNYRRNETRQIETRFSIYNKRFTEKFIEYMEGVTKARNRFIPRKLLQFSTRILKHLYYGLIITDGNKEGNGYSSASEQLINDMQELCLKCKIYARTSKKAGKGIYTDRYHYYLHIWNKTKKRISHINGKKHIDKIFYNGRVYCLQTRNGTVVTRRNGMPVVSGNSSFYPTIIRTFNLSPETTHFMNVTNPEQLKLKDGFISKYKENSLLLSIPDTVLNRQVYIRIDNSQPGFLSQSIASAIENRLRYKREGQELEDQGKIEEYRSIYSLEQALKILINSAYGLEGQLSSEYGSLPVAIAIVGIARWILSEISRSLGDKGIEQNTDGLYIKEKVSEKEANAILYNLIKNTVPEDSIIGQNIKQTGTPGYLCMELEKEWDVGVFYGMKNYALLKGDKLTISGSSLKSSRYAYGVRRFLSKITKLDLQDASRDTYRKFMAEQGDPTLWKLEDFVCVAKFTTEESGYSDFRRINIALAEQIKEIEGSPPKEGDRVEYFFTRRFWQQERKMSSSSHSKQIVTVRSLVKSTDEINMDKYRQQIERALSIVGKSTEWIESKGSILEMIN